MINRYRITIVQRVIASYREKIFNELGRKNDLQFIYGDSQGEHDVKDATLPRDSAKARIIRYVFNSKLWFYAGVLKELKEFNPDILIVQPTPRNLSFFKIIRFCKLNKKPLIGWGMGQMPNRGKVLSIIHSYVQRPLINRLDGMIVYSTKAYNYYRHTLGFSGEIQIAFNSVDISNFSDLGERSYDFNEGVNLVYVGRIIPSKNISKLFPMLRRNNNWNLSIVGDMSTKYCQELKSEAADIGNQIKFVGPLFEEELNIFLNLQHIFVLPGLGGLAINHAMASGLPVFVSNADGTEADLIKNEETGFLYEENNYEQLEYLLKENIKHPEKLMSIGNKALTHINKNFTIENTIQKINTFCEKINA